MFWFMFYCCCCCFCSCSIFLLLFSSYVYIWQYIVAVLHVVDICSLYFVCGYYGIGGYVVGGILHALLCCNFKTKAKKKTLQIIRSPFENFPGCICVYVCVYVPWLFCIIFSIYLRFSHKNCLQKCLQIRYNMWSLGLLAVVAWFFFFELFDMAYVKVANLFPVLHCRFWLVILFPFRSCIRPLLTL